MNMNTATPDWSAFYAQLHGFVAARVRNAPDTDDLVQQILERATLKAASLESAVSARAWLFGIARNAIVDHYRARSRADGSEPEAWEDLPADDAALSESDRASVLSCMEPLLLTLPVATQQLLRWADIEDRSMQYIAEQLDLTVTASKSRVQRARQEFVAATRRCCAITLDARGRVTDLTPRAPAPPTDCGECQPKVPLKSERKPS